MAPDVRFDAHGLAFDAEPTSLIRILILEQRFWKKEVGQVMIDLSHYTATDRIDRWFKMVGEDGEKRGELRLRIRFSEEPFDEQDVEVAKKIDEFVMMEDDGQDAPLRFEQGLQVAAMAADTFKHGEPFSWILFDFLRSTEVDKVTRKGHVLIRIRILSPPDENVSFTLLCGDLIVSPALGALYELNVTYEPQSYFLKMFVFLHIMSDSPIASATLIFDEEKLSTKWYPMYKRGHPEFQKLPHGALKNLAESSPDARLAQQAMILKFFSHVRILGDRFFSEPPKERGGGAKTVARTKIRHLAFVTTILLIMALFAI